MYALSRDFGRPENQLAKSKNNIKEMPYSFLGIFHKLCPWLFQWLGAPFKRDLQKFVYSAE